MTAALALATFAALCLTGCIIPSDADQRRARELQGQSIKACIATGGMPYFDPRQPLYLAECRYPPPPCVRAQPEKPR